jgi:hypothetical protein
MLKRGLGSLNLANDLPRGVTCESLPFEYRFLTHCHALLVVEPHHVRGHLLEAGFPIERVLGERKWF